MNIEYHCFDKLDLFVNQWINGNISISLKFEGDIKNFITFIIFYVESK